MKISLALCSLALASILAVPLPAQTAGSDFKKIDLNADGRISAEEARSVAELQANFDTLDRNHDGLLTSEEFAVWTGTGKAKDAEPVSPGTGPSGSGGAQHMPKT